MCVYGVCVCEREREREKLLYFLEKEKVTFQRVDVNVGTMLQQEQRLLFQIECNCEEQRCLAGVVLSIDV